MTTDQDTQIPRKNLRLHIAVAASGKSQGQIARQAGITQTHLSDIKYYRAKPNPQVMQRIADVLEMPVEELFDIREVSTDVDQ